MEGSQTLVEALDKYEVSSHYGEIQSDQIQLLQDYVEMLWEWNERMNLTRHTTWDKFVSRDLIDTLELAKLLEPEETVLDVGTGGGMPGIPLAILRPDLVIGLSESVVKKARAVQGIVVDFSGQRFSQGGKIDGRAGIDAHGVSGSDAAAVLSVQ